MIVELCVPLICKQTPWTDLDREEKEQLDYEEMIAMIGQDGVNDEEESIKINEDQEVNIFEHLLSTNEIHLKKRSFTTSMVKTNIQSNTYVNIPFLKLLFHWLFAT